jgi:hypothetical protein
VKAKDTLKLAYSSREGATMESEGGSPLPPQISCGGLKEGNDGKSSQTQPTLALRESNKKIN